MTFSPLVGREDKVEQWGKLGNFGMRNQNADRGQVETAEDHFLSDPSELLREVFGSAIANSSAHSDERRRIKCVDQIVERLNGSALLASGHVMFAPQLGLDPVHQVAPSLTPLSLSLFSADPPLGLAGIDR